MFKVQSYQKSVKLLPWGACVVLLLVYWFAISETVKLRHEAHDLEKNVTAMKGAPLEIAAIKTKLSEINKTAGGNTNNTGTDPLMELTSSLASANNVTLAEYQPLHTYKNQNYTIDSRIAGFDAPFIPCLKVLYNLEKEYHNGKVVSVNFSTVKDYKTSQKHLTMQIIIQSIQNERNPI